MSCEGETFVSWHGISFSCFTTTVGRASLYSAAFMIINSNCICLQNAAGFSRWSMLSRAVRVLRPSLMAARPGPMISPVQSSLRIMGRQAGAAAVAAGAMPRWFSTGSPSGTVIEGEVVGPAVIDAHEKVEGPGVFATKCCCACVIVPA